MNDTELMDWLETQLGSKWKNSIFIGQEIDGSKMVNLDVRALSGMVFRAKTVRGAIKLAIEHEAWKKGGGQ
jgi:hypothetical protein